MDRDELRKRIEIERKRVEAATKKRNIIATLVFIGIYLLIFYFLSDKLDDFNDYFRIFLSAVITGILHHAINGAIYEELHAREKADRWLLEQLNKELREKEDTMFEQRLAEDKKNLH
jgi:multisubunit Na+/H+ antiporter MnhG subunit